MAVCRLLSGQKKREDRALPKSAHQLCCRLSCGGFVCVMCSFEFVLCAVARLCYVQVSVCLMWSF